MNDQSISSLFQKLFQQVESLAKITATPTAQQPESNFTVQETTSNSIVALDSALKIHHKYEEFNYTLTNICEQLHLLQNRFSKQQLLYKIVRGSETEGDMKSVVETVMDAVWHTYPITFAAVILGETELGPYTYRSLRGVADAWRYLNQECPFPLWGVLARALLPRVDSTDPDHLNISDIQAAKRPLPEEFPWMDLYGSLLILPLRKEDRVIGAILIGNPETHYFDNPLLCDDYYAIASHAAQAIQRAQSRQELTILSTKLVSLQALTKSLAGVETFEHLNQVLTEHIHEIIGEAEVMIFLTQQVALNSTHMADIPLAVRRIVEWATQAGQPIFYDPEEAFSYLEQFYNESGKALVVPVMQNEQTLAVIHAMTTDPGRRFEVDDMIVLRTIANCAAVILMNLPPGPN